MGIRVLTVLAVLGCAACTRIDPDTSTPPTADTATKSAATAVEPAPTVSTPAAAARSWLAAYHSASWTDAGPTRWTARVAPHISIRLAEEYRLLRDGATGMDWQSFSEARCRTTVADLDAVRPPESPGDDTTANILVSGTATTACATPTTPPTTRPVAATVVLVHTDTGWKVDRHLY